MLLLIQLLRRLEYLEYSRAETIDVIRQLQSGDLSIDDLFWSLNLERPTSARLERLKHTLNQPALVDAALSILSSEVSIE